MVSPRARRSAVACLMTERGLSQRRACRLVGLDRSSARYRSRPRADEAATIALVREYAHEQPMYGYRLIAAMLRHDGYGINRKRVYRIWRQEGLQLPRRHIRKRRYGDSSGILRRATKPNEVWTYDFLEARTERGGKLRMLCVLDEYTQLSASPFRSSGACRRVRLSMSWTGSFSCAGTPATSARIMGQSSLPMPFKPGCVTVSVRRSTSPQGVRGRTHLSRVSTGRFVPIA